MPQKVLSVSLIFSPFFDICDLLLKRPMTTWNGFVLIKKGKMLLMVKSFMHLSTVHKVINKNQSKCICSLAYYVNNYLNL